MESINKQLYSKFELDRMKRYAFDAGICRLIARYQFNASDGDGASKYRMALLSTNRKALPWTILAGCGSVCIRRTAQRSTGDE